MPVQGQYYQLDEKSRPVLDDEGNPVIVPERSFLIEDMSFEDGSRLGASYKQHSIIYKGRDGLVGMYTTDGSNQVIFPEGPSGELVQGEQALHISPTPELWSKTDQFSFEFPFRWEQIPLAHQGHPVRVEEAQEHLKGPQVTEEEPLAPEMGGPHVVESSVIVGAV